MNKIIILVVSIALIVLQQQAVSQVNDMGKTATRVNTDNDTATGMRKTGDPFAKLPSNIERLTYFGERADISPDNIQVAFMSKSFMPS